MDRDIICIVATLATYVRRKDTLNSSEKCNDSIASSKNRRNVIIANIYILCILSLKHIATSSNLVLHLRCKKNIFVREGGGGEVRYRVIIAHILMSFINTTL